MPNRRDVIRLEVERICSSRGFENADRLKELLRYTVEKSLAGRAQELKEYALGIDVFGRGDDFDPKLDSLVRVTAGKLRQRLKEYYAENASGGIRIEYRSGSYAPEFVAQQRTHRQWPLWAGAAVVLMLIAGTAAMVISPRKSGQKVLSKLTADAAIARDAAISLDGKLVAYVSNREGDHGFQLYVQMVEGGPPIILTGITGNAVSLASHPMARRWCSCKLRPRILSPMDMSRPAVCDADAGWLARSHCGWRCRSSFRARWPVYRLHKGYQSHLPGIEKGRSPKTNLTG
jgi:hypothetical protein